MLKPAMDVMPEPSAFTPLLIILLVAVVALDVALVMVRLLRRAGR
jgi:hypothetical protein